MMPHAASACPQGSRSKLAQAMAGFPDARREHLIPLLQAVQESEGYLSREAIVAIAEHLRLPASKVYGVATFYSQFRFQGQGRYHVQVCRGTTCHVKGSAEVFTAVKRALKIDEGQTTKDGLFSLETVACMGSCAVAPNLTVAGEPLGAMSADKVTGLLGAYRRKAAP